ncbi:MAG: SDR family NAD(P)-dependent oxidoreductase, partial [Acidobacteria bacterium]|nr:SDR family NAD(P)-dependent oxidoreductase [Acidobacteriota bacterium]
MRFGRDDIQQFAAWSGDRNPLHVDADAARRSVFGQPVVHGMLSAIHALTDPVRPPSPPRRIEIEFRAAAFIDTDYALEDSGTTLTLRGEDQVLALLHLGDASAAPDPDVAWVAAARHRRDTLPRPRQEPAAPGTDALKDGLEVIGVYETSAPPAAYLGDGRLHPVQARALGLCSYVIGMEIPGLRSLFTRLSLTFAPELEDATELLYRARTVRFDRHFRILDVALEIFTLDGRFIAAGDLRSYVRFSPVVTDPSALAASLSRDSRAVGGRVALVCGGSRGLGADLTAALAIGGAHVYASYRRDADAARDLAATLQASGAHVEFLEGDAGDPAWCEATRQAILARHGRLDVLVLNACAPPAQLRLGAESARAWTNYVAANLPLAQVPVATMLPDLAASAGTIVCISSSFVADPPAGFGHYVALKEAVEATVRSAVREAPGVHALVARPPRLQTAWNDTPTGVLGTIPSSQAAVHIVNRLADAARTDALDLLSEFPAVPSTSGHRGAPLPAGLAQAAPEFFIGLSASFTPEPILDGLNFWFEELGVSGDVEVAPYGQVLQTLLSPAGGLSGRPGTHVVLLRLRDWLRELPAEQAGSPEFLAPYLENAVHDLERAMRTHRAQASAETLLVVCPSPPAGPDEAEALLERAEADLLDRLSALPGLTTIRARDFHATYKVDEGRIADRVREHIAHIPYQASYFHTLATLVMRHVHRRLAAARKVVVVDCDNTLWRGVVGEVGAEGLVFDEGHAALHRALVRLAESGVLIALCSKNEEADVWRVFESRTDLGIRREQIVAASINWQAKSVNLRAMADRLNLGLDSFLFIDDNPVECAEVRAACPKVLTLEWPQDADRAIRLLRHTWELDARGATAEDRRRTELYKEEFRRQELQTETLTFRDFIASLELVVEIAPLAPEDLKRASQLTLRTNQFNFTTRRREEGDLQALTSAGRHDVRTVRVRDRFGDYGLVGLLIAEHTADEVFADTFLLSCRVLGRGVEHQMVAELGRIAEAHGATAVRLRVEPTKRNTPARSFLEQVAPADLRRVADGVVEAVLPARDAAALTFEPPEQAGPSIAEDRGDKSLAPANAAQLRSREAQIHRTAFELSTLADVTRAIEGVPAPATVAPASLPADNAYVFEAFADALKISVERVKEVDNLEALGCDSFKIVEITVSLLERFPGLPGTLLFEHRSVSEIAARLRQGFGGASAEGEPADAGTRHSPTPRPAGPIADIAVVGMHLRTAGAQSPAELWDLLSAGRTAVAAVATDRQYFLGRLEDHRTHFAGMLGDVDRFDAELFGITPREAELMDPQLRLFLEVAWAALEDAGILGDALEAETGVFAGVMYGDYAYRANLVAKEAENPFKCWEGFSLANRLSQVFGFRGPSLAVDTACSSSGTAVHLACRALAAGDCRVALAGGVNLILDPDRFVQLGRLGILSASGQCLAFGADADGTVLGEGAG